MATHVRRVLFVDQPIPLGEFGQMIADLVIENGFDPEKAMIRITKQPGGRHGLIVRQDIDSYRELTGQVPGVRTYSTR